MRDKKRRFFSLSPNSMATNYLALRSSAVVNLTLSTLTGSTITGSTITAPTVLYSTLRGSTILGTTLTLSTLTVSSINNNAPGTGSFSTLTVSSLVSVSSIQTTSTLYTSSMITTGNVGIGITNPSYQLQLTKSIQAMNLTHFNWNMNSLGYPGTATGGALYWKIATLGPYNSNSAWGQLSIKGSLGGWAINANDQMSVDVALMTRGGVSIQGIIKTNNYTNAVSIMDLQYVINASNQYDVYIVLKGNAYYAFDLDVGSSGGQSTANIILYDPSTITAVSTAPTGTFVSITSTCQMYVIANNVGIGTATPAATLDVAGIIQGQTAFQSNTNANNVGMGALQTVYLGQYGAAAPRGTSVRWGDVLGAAYYATTGSYNLSFYKDVSGGNAAVALQIIGTSATNTTPNVYIPNSLGIGTATTQAKFHLDNGSTQGLNALFYASGLGAGQNTSIAIGKAFSTANSGTILWNHVADGSTSNFLGLGAFGGDNKLNVLASGFVGIGITNPSASLHVVASASSANRTNCLIIKNSYNGQTGITLDGTSVSGGHQYNIWTTTTGEANPVGGLSIYDDTAGAYRMVISSGGNVGIGTSSAAYPLTVYGNGGTYVPGGNNPYLQSPTIGVSNTTGYGAVTGWFQKDLIAGGAVGTFSDQRIKNNIQPVTNALATIEQLHMVSHGYIDQIENPQSCSVGLIAQEVRKVVPDAVSLVTNFIPNIMCVPQLATLLGDVIELTFDHPIDLNATDQVRLILKDRQVDQTVFFVSDDRTMIRVSAWSNADPNNDQIFVYGKQVNDFHILDKPKMGLLALAGVKELALEFRSENTALKSKVEALESALEFVLARLSAAGI